MTVGMTLPSKLSIEYNRYVEKAITVRPLEGLSQVFDSVEGTLSIPRLR